MTPKNYADCINKLVDEGIIPQKYQQKFRNLIQMRNLIVHQYVEIDHEILFSGLTTLHDAFMIFQNSILTWMQESV